MFFYILSCSQKTTGLVRFSCPSQKIWLQNLSNEYIYAEQNPNRTRDIRVQSWHFLSRKRPRFSPKFSLRKYLPENWQVTKGFMMWLFLNWSIDYQIENKKTKFGRITFWIFNHPISHCVIANTFYLIMS